MLTVFVEGLSDLRFIKHHLELKGLTYEDDFTVAEYAGQKTIKTNNHIKSIKQIPGRDYIFISDIDHRSLEETTDLLLNTYSELEIDNIKPVNREIESWYLAGLDIGNSKLKLKKKIPRSTEQISKEQFLSHFDCMEDVEIMLDILESFSIDLAKARNSSFQIYEEYVCNTYI